MDELRASQLVAFIEARLEAAKLADGANLRLVGGPTEDRAGTETPANRAWLLRRVRFLQANYALDFLVDQETYRVDGGLQALPLLKLQRLQLQMEKARELILDGINLEDAGLVRSIT